LFWAGSELFEQPDKNIASNRLMVRTGLATFKLYKRMCVRRDSNPEPSDP